MKILFLFGGSKYAPEALPLAAKYQERIAHTETVDLQILQSKEVGALRIQNDECSRMLALIQPSDLVICFDERGKVISSIQFSALFEQAEQESRRAVICVGGAYGFTDTLRARANHILSFGTMVFPHDLARIMALEQTYRARSISRGSKYHHL